MWPLSLLIVFLKVARAALEIENRTIISISRRYLYMSFPHKVKSALWTIVDAMACNTDRFVKNPGKDFTRDRKLGLYR